MQTALVAFDSNQMVLILSKMLERLNFEVISVENTQQLRLHLEKKSACILFTDWILNNDQMDNFLSTLQTPKPKVIFISKQNHPEAIMKALKIGVDEYIIKPFDNDILQSKLSMVGLS